MKSFDQRIPERLPLLDLLLAERPVGDRPLEDVTAILVQHHRGSLVPKLRTLFRLGLDPRHTFLVDIPYSTNPAVIAAVRALGVPADNLAKHEYRLDQPFAPCQLRRVSQLLDVVRQGATDGRVLVLDDGAYVLDAMSRTAGLPGRLSVVEQTVFGMRKVRERPEISAYGASVPVLNVAESRPKKILEAAFLGPAIARALASAESLVLERLHNGRTLLLGYGAIGRAVALALCTEVGVAPDSLFVGDPSRAARAQATRDGLPIWRRRQEQLFDVVIGCSGRGSFRPEDVRFVVNGAFLASGSSGTIEFSREAILDLCAEPADERCFIHGDQPLADRMLHDAIEIRLFDRDVVLLNGGYPIDFDGSVNGTVGGFIQLTETLMVGGALQALSARPGVLTLDNDFVEWIERRFREIDHDA